MVPEIKVEVSGLQALQGMSEGLRDLSPAFRGPVRDIFWAMMKAQFQAEGGYTSDEWVPLSPAYARWKQRTYGDKPILQRQGFLVRSLTEDTEWSVIRTGPTFGEYGTRVPYAATHHYGDERRRIPKREVIPTPSREDGRRVADAILGFLLGKARAALRSGGVKS